MGNTSFQLNEARAQRLMKRQQELVKVYDDATMGIASMTEGWLLTELGASHFLSDAGGDGMAFARWLFSAWPERVDEVQAALRLTTPGQPALDMLMEMQLRAIPQRGGGFDRSQKVY